MHPSIVLDLNYTDHLVDVIGDRFDAVVRSTRPRDSQLVARRLGAFAFRVCASPAYLARHGIPRTPSELVRHGCLLFRFETTGKLQPWAFRRSVLRSLPESVTCNSMPAVLDAAIRGLGLAFMPDFLAREAVAAKRLQYVLTDHVGPPGTFWMLWPQGARQTAKLRAFIDFFAPRLFPGAPG
jgi:DNA-binding transcriptional LysR family regulator